jgi:hypothetical protein
MPLRMPPGLGEGRSRSGEQSGKGPRWRHPAWEQVPPSAAVRRRGEAPSQIGIHAGSYQVSGSAIASLMRSTSAAS